MKIAIHNRPGSFSDRWIDYCKNKGIDYKLVNAYNTDIVDQVSDCDAFMMHHHHGDSRDVLFAKQLLYSLETAGVRCFPNFYTTWHFDDKVGQKYLLEAINAPVVPSYVFYSKKEALEWIQHASFPKVFKLRGGAGASNVLLVKNACDAKKLVRKSFGKGFKNNKTYSLKERYRKWRMGQDTLLGVLKGFGRIFIKTDFDKMHAPEKGYVYFQDFIENKAYDVRVVVVGNKAFAIKRIAREDDFRMGDSYSKDEMPIRCIEVSFAVSKRLNYRCVAFDYVFDNKKNPSVVEIKHAFVLHGYDHCPGYWTDDMDWHHVDFNPQAWMAQDSESQNDKHNSTEGGKVLITSELLDLFLRYGIPVSNNRYDLRVVVIGNKAMGEKRLCRENDFRASGSGEFQYIPLRDDVLEIAFQTSRRLKLQSVAFDFIFCENKPLIVEMSYAFGTHGISHCPGYYSEDHIWHEVPEPNFYGWMVEDLIRIEPEHYKSEFNENV